MAGELVAFDFAAAVLDRLAIRRRLLRLTPLASVRRRAVASRRLHFAAPGLANPQSAALAATVHSGRAFVTAAPELLSAEACALLESMVAAGPEGWDWQPGQPGLESEDILPLMPELYHIGLEDAVLDVAENYLLEPCYYHGCCLKREKADAIAIGTRQWHIDVEDDRMLRLIVYLNDVGEGGGPLEYLDADRTAAARAALDYRSGYIGDRTMRGVVPDLYWTSVTGPAGTLVAFDGTRLFHRASTPTRSDRFSVTFTFTSRHPRQIWRPTRLRAESRRRLVADLPSRQAACIPPARWA